jgi:hypothetical protein
MGDTHEHEPLRPLWSHRGAWLGALLAWSIPAVSIVGATLWDTGLLSLDPDGPVVGFLQAAAFPALLVAPVGLIVIAWSVGVRSALAWAAWLVVTVPVTAVAWFIGAAYLGGLAGEPF